MDAFLALSDRLTEKWLAVAPQKRELFSRIMILLPFCVMIFAFGLNFRLIGDEGPWTLQVVSKFSEQWPFPDIVNYRSSTTPLPYLIFAGFGKLVGFEIWKLRLITFFLTFLAVNIFYDLCKQYKLPSPLLGALSLLFFPYVFFHGFTVYTVCFALFFEVIALKFYLVENPSIKSLLGGSIAATLAIYSRQEYLAIPVGMLLYEFIHLVKENNYRATIKANFLRWFILAIPLMLILPLFILWGGTNPPVQQEEFYLTIIPQHLSFVPIFIGAYFFSALVSIDFKILFKNKLFILFVFLILGSIYVAFPLEYSEEIQIVAVGKGIISHGLDLFAQYVGSFVSEALKAFLWIAGLILILSELLNSELDSIKMKLFSILVSFVGLITLTPYVAERYYVLAVAPLVIIFHKSQRNWMVNLLWLLWLITISIVFSYWQIYLKSFENW